MNRISIPKVKHLPQCNRAKLDTGKFCNYDCVFCYYKDHLDERDSLQEVYDRVNYIHDYGITEIDLSGGESSIDPNWFDVLDYCNNKFKHISCVSHGGKFANKDFLQRSIDHGLKEILFSLHGHSPDTHDNITQRKGSFNKIIQAIHNCNELGIIVRINCTVYQPLLTNYAALIKRLKPTQLNFITLNYWNDNGGFKQIEYQSLTKSIQNNIDILKDSVSDINVRYTPYCYMKGYEQYVVGQFQHIHDLTDWNKALYRGTLNTSISYTEKEKLKHAYDAAAKDRIEYYYKPKECVKCQYFYECDGIENQLKGIKCYPY